MIESYKIFMEPRMISPISFSSWRVQLGILEENTVDTRNLLNAIKSMLPRYRTKKIKTLKCLHAGDIEVIRPIIQYSLELIGQNSNKRFGISAREQDEFFSRPCEIQTIFTHLFLAITRKKMEVVFEESKGEVQVNGSVPINDIHLAVRNLPTAVKSFFRYENKNLTERQIYSAIVIYAFSKFCEFYKTEWHQITNEIFSKIELYHKGISYSSADGKRGGHESGRQRKEPFDVGYEIFKSHSLINYKKVSAIASAIQKELALIEIKRSIETLETKWVPSFIKRYHQEYG